MSGSSKRKKKKIKCRTAGHPPSIALAKPSLIQSIDGACGFTTSPSNYPASEPTSFVKNRALSDPGNEVLQDCRESELSVHASYSGDVKFNGDSVAHRKERDKIKKNSKLNKLLPESSVSGFSYEKSLTTGKPHVECACQTGSSFEEELTWCIRQLQTSSVTSDIEKYQKVIFEKNIKTLTSTKTPLPRKRQLMRSVFGDYRSKMRTNPVPDSQIYSTAPSISVMTMDKQQSKCYKPAASRSAMKKHVTSMEGNSICDARSDGSSSVFKFNFDISNPDMQG